jgi:molecular chaperone DnaK (HSP70)
MGFPWGIDFGNANCVMAGTRLILRLAARVFCRT